MRGRLKSKKAISSVIAVAAALTLLLASVCSVFAVTNIIVISVGDEICESFESGGYDCILVLGAGLRPDGTPSDMLADRLDVAIDLYKGGASQSILLSGDCSEERDYDEVSAMKKYCLDRGVPEENIDTDGKGYSTYESILNVKNGGKYKSIVIVTQKYHLHRALYISEKMELSAVGADATTRDYRGQIFRDVREIAARTKDFFIMLFFDQE